MQTSQDERKILHFASWSSSFPFDAAAIRLHEMASVEVGPDFLFNWQPGMDRVLFVYVLRGSGTVEYEASSLRMAPGQALLLNIKPGYVAKSNGDIWDFIWIQMSGRLANELCAYVQKDRGSPVFDASPEVLQLYDRIQALATPNDWSQYRDIEICSALYHLLGILHSAPAGSIRTAAAVQYIHDHYAENLEIDMLAKLCMISPYHFIRCFREKHGTTPHTYITLFRINTAKKLLLNTSQSISMIAERVGFEDASYFSRIFKKHTGYLPKDFRRFSHF